MTLMNSFVGVMAAYDGSQKEGGSLSAAYV